MAYELEFEKPLAELEKKIVALQRKGDRLKHDEQVQLQEMERDLRQRTEEIYKNLTAWQTVQVARHKDRPYSADYIQLMCDDFFELHGDRCFAGPRVIEGFMHVKLPEGAVSAEFALQHGMIDAVVHRRDLRQTLARLLRMYAEKAAI